MFVAENKFHLLAAMIDHGLTRSGVQSVDVAISVSETDWIELLSIPRIDSALMQDAEKAKAAGGVASVMVYNVHWCKGS